MALFQFLADLMQRFGISLTLDSWYFASVQSIGFLPHEQVAEILRAYGHAVSGTVCGLTMMRDDGQFNRTIPQIWIAEPDAACPVDQLRYFLEHELTHVLHWIRDGVSLWPGHP